MLTSLFKFSCVKKYNNQINMSLVHFLINEANVREEVR